MIVSTCLWRTSEDLQSSMLLSPIPHTQTGRSSSGPLPSFLRSVPPPPCPHVALLHGNYSLPPTSPHSHSPGCVPTHPCPPHAIGRRAHLDTSHLLLAGGKHFAGSHSGRRRHPAPWTAPSTLQVLTVAARPQRGSTRAPFSVHSPFISLALFLYRYKILLCISHSERNCMLTVKQKDGIKFGTRRKGPRLQQVALREVSIVHSWQDSFRTVPVCQLVCCLTRMTSPHAAARWPTSWIPHQSPPHTPH